MGISTETKMAEDEHDDLGESAECVNDADLSVDACDAWEEEIDALTDELLAAIRDEPWQDDEIEASYPRLFNDTFHS
jgi:hypothetical protein